MLLSGNKKATMTNFGLRQFSDWKTFYIYINVLFLTFEEIFHNIPKEIFENKVNNV